MRVLALIILTGCGIHATLHPAELDVCGFYCRQTDCPGGVPPQLTERKVPPNVTLDAVLNGTDDPPPDHCRTMEVGPKTLAQVISAIGTALGFWFGGH